MQPETNSVIAAFVDAVNRHALAYIGLLMSDDHAFVDSQGHTETGRDRMCAAWKAYFDLFPDYKIEIDCIVTENEVAAVFGRTSGTYLGKHGLAPENRIAMPAAWKVHVQDGRIALWQVYADWSVGMKIIERENQKG